MIAVANDSSVGIVLGDKGKASIIPYIIYVVSRTLGELKVLETACGGLTSEYLLCYLSCGRLADGKGEDILRGVDTEGE